MLVAEWVDNSFPGCAVLDGRCTVVTQCDAESGRVGGIFVYKQYPRGDSITIIGHTVNGTASIMLVRVCRLPLATLGPPYRSRDIAANITGGRRSRYHEPDFVFDGNCRISGPGN
jgi:hypothetical protein